MFDLYLDIETYSPVNLKESGVYRYVTHPEFQILMLAYAIGDASVDIVTEPDDILRIINLTQDPDITTWAHNSTFERVCFSAALGLDVGAGEVLSPESWEDTQPLAALHGYPQSLEKMGVALGGELKDTAGTLLINTFSKPRRDGSRTLPEDRPERWEEFKRYCMQDVEVLRDAARALPGWPPGERVVWLLDQRINDRGIRVDTDQIDAAITAAGSNRLVQELELSSRTGIHNPGSTVQLLEWAQAEGLDMLDFKKETVAEVLERDGLDENHRRVLELRQELALTAAKKYEAAKVRVSADGRLRGSFQYHGAHTGRWAGRGVQLQNLPSEQLPVDHEAGETADDVIHDAVLDLKTSGEAPAHTLKALVRSMFTGPITVVDFSAIEARVLAWLAGESWALEAFAAGRDIYVETAKRMGPSYTRKDGKIATLALGYNGGVGSLEAMGATGSGLQDLVTTWRRANPAIQQLWGTMQDSFRQGNRRVGDRVSILREGNSRHMMLPSGRSISYHRVGLRWVMKQWPSGDVSRIQQLSYVDPARYPYRKDTYGGRLVENATQAVARDILAEAMVRLEAAGYAVVGHVHDEVLVEGTDLAGVTEIMNQSPVWADGLPLASDGFVAPRYRKD